jgi:leukotriene-A4 hydrolase
MATTINMPRDPNTLSNYNNWTTKHTKAELVIDFKAQKLVGYVTLDLQSITQGESEEIILDTSYLDVTDISLNGVKTNDWNVKDRFEPYGSPLSIKVPGGKPENETVSVHITLSTSSKCTALQWLTPAQTKGKYPYMFSQCQAIHNRSLFPCQDTPDVKSTYEFIISSPLPVIASGVPVDNSAPQDKDTYGEANKTYHFIQKIPMPSYLFALASGDIVTAPIGPRSVVATTPGKDLADAKWELERDMEKFIEVAESLIFPYVWGQYNVLVLPASFPYGILLFQLLVDKLLFLILGQVGWKILSSLSLRRPSFPATVRMST